VYVCEHQDKRAEDGRHNTSTVSDAIDSQVNSKQLKERPLVSPSQTKQKPRAQRTDLGVEGSCRQKRHINQRQRRNKKMRTLNSEHQVETQTHFVSKRKQRRAESYFYFLGGRWENENGQKEKEKKKVVKKTENGD